MEQSNQQAEILELGRKIVNELSPDENDKLSLLEKWMGHYIAELILKIEIEGNELVKDRLQKECFETILKLWKERDSLPCEIMPMNRIKTAICTLSELKKTRSVWDRMRNSDETSWEGAVLQIHDNYLEILRICFQASIEQEALSKEKAWVNEFSEFLSEDEKAIVNELESFLEDPEQASSIIIGTDKREVGSDNEKNDRMIKIFNRLEGIVDGQKKLFKRLKTELLDNKD